MVFFKWSSAAEVSNYEPDSVVESGIGKVAVPAPDTIEASRAVSGISLSGKSGPDQ